MTSGEGHMAPNNERERLLIYGYFGGRNFGDELMLIGLIREIRHQFAADIRIITPAGVVPEYLRGEISGAYPKTAAGFISGVKWCSGFILCGGTMFHDSFSGRRHAAYRKNLVALACLCIVPRIFGRSVRLASVGIGPLKRPFTIGVVRMVVAAANQVSVRDTRSLDDLVRIGVPRPRIGLAQDLALSGVAELPEWQPDPDRAILVVSLVARDLISVVSPRDAAEFIAGMKDLLSTFLEEYADGRLIILATQVGEVDHDRAIAAELAETLSAKAPTRVDLQPFRGNPHEFADLLSRATAVVAARYHIATAAELIGVPTMWIAYQRKVLDGAAELQVPPERIASPTHEGAERTGAWLAKTLPGRNDGAGAGCAAESDR